MPDDVTAIIAPGVVDDRNDEWWSAARVAFCERIDDTLRERSRSKVLPWDRPVPVGRIDFWKVHAYGLDRLDELIGCLLPDGDLVENDTAWRGRLDDRSPWIIVSLLSGAWSDPASGRRGDDLVSLVAHVLRMKPGRVAIRLGVLLGIEAVRRG
jgi:hypothetical protein